MEVCSEDFSLQKEGLKSSLQTNYQGLPIMVKAAQ
jgi:hypothetical protein